MCEACFSDNPIALDACSSCDEVKPDEPMASASPPKKAKRNTSKSRPASGNNKQAPAAPAAAAQAPPKVAATYTLEEKPWTNDQCVAAYGTYEFACITQKANVTARNEPGTRARLHDTLAKIHEGMRVTLTGPAVEEKTAAANRPPTTTCQSCHEDLDDTNRIQLGACGHDTHCRTCVAGFCKAKISDDQVGETLASRSFSPFTPQPSA
jgi:hypothetical protein